MQIAPSPRFIAALQDGGFTVTPKIEIWTPGATVPSFSSVLPTAAPSNALDLYITDGSVTMDKKQDIRGQGTVTLVSPGGTYIPKQPSDLFTPWGNEIHLYYGITYPDSTQDFVLLGKHRISRVVVDESQGAPTMTLTTYDRARNVSRNVIPYLWPTTAINNAIQNQSWAFLAYTMIQDRYPAAQFVGTASDWTAQMLFPPVYNHLGTLQILIGGGGIPYGGIQALSQGTDMWSTARQYAQASGCDLTVTRDGRFTCYTEPNYVLMSSLSPIVPTATFIEGKTAMFDHVTRTLDDQAAFNAVIVYGGGTAAGNLPVASCFVNNVAQTEGSTFLFDGQAHPIVDNDPNSPTYYDGPYGQVTHVITNNFLVTQDEVNNLAAVILVTDIGAQENVQIPNAAANPLLDVDDVIGIQRQRIGIGPNPNQAYIIDALTIPMVAKTAMTVTVREKRDISFQ